MAFALIVPTSIPSLVERVSSLHADDVICFWDPTLGPLPEHEIARFEGSLDDAWHPGTALRGRDEDDLLRYAQPLWSYRPDPAADAEGVINWKLDLRATIVRGAVLRKLGGLDPRFDSLGGLGLELGLRMIRRGAVVRQVPRLYRGSVRPLPPSLADRYRILRGAVGDTWVRYTVARRVLDGKPLSGELAALAEASQGKPLERAPIGALAREISDVVLPRAPRVSVILPTFGRYKYVAEVLDDLRAQTIRPTEILIADGNAPEDREPQVYERYRDLPITVIWHEEVGICSGRNECLRRSTGDYVWFVDDDSRFAADNLEAHLRVMAAYGADVSVGPAYMKERPELVPEQQEVVCSFMDCGTTVCTRDILARAGGFDMRFNNHLMGEDNELGLRFLKAGGLMVNNPYAKRFHYLAPVGGSRSKGSAHRFERWSLRPRPVKSVYYLARRHFERPAAWDAMLQASLTVGWKRRGNQKPTPRARLETLVAEVAALPLTLLRFWRSARDGQTMLDEGPEIPDLSQPQDPEVVSVQEGEAL